MTSPLDAQRAILLRQLDEHTENGEFLWNVFVSNIGGGPSIVEVVGIRPLGDTRSLGTMQWPTVERDLGPLPYDEEAGCYDMDAIWELLRPRIELIANWVAIS